MATLDPLLDSMAGAEASELVLRSGEVPFLQTPRGATTVGKAPISETQVLKVASELADLQGRARLDGRQGAAFSYRGFAVSVAFLESAVEMRVAPGAATAGSAAAPGVIPEAPTAPTRSAIDDLLRVMIDRGASDLHLTTGEPARLRLHGDMVALDGGPVPGARMTELLWPICPAKNRQEWERDHDTDFAYEVPGLARFRCNYFMDRTGMGAVFRQIPSRIPTVEELGIPRHVLDFCWLSKGFVVITGPTGSGKSTTLAALVDSINRSRGDHIITIEDPIEFVHPNRRCLVNQREVGSHTGSFKRALRAALREDPDIVLVGEMRDLETVAIAIETAETGHLVFGTLHTTTAPSTVDRIIDQFPADRQAQIRVMLSDTLKGVVSQTLCRKKGGGRVAAFEILVVNSAVSNLIREGKTFQIPSLMQTQRGLGNVLMNSSLLELVNSGMVEPQEAYIKAVDKVGLRGLFERAGILFEPGNEGGREASG